MRKKILNISASFLFALGIWGSVSLSENYFTSVALPIKFVELPANYTVSSNSIDTVYLNMRAQGWRLASLNLGGGSYYNVSAEMDSGAFAVNLRNSLTENNWLSSGAQVINIYPDNINFRVDKIVSKKVRVKWNAGFEFSPNYSIVSEIKLYPDSVMIYGPKAKLDTINFIKAEYVKFTDIEKDISEHLELAPQNGLSYNTMSVVLKASVDKIVDRTFDGLLVETRDVPPSTELTLYPNNVSVVLRGGLNFLGRLKEEDLRVFVNFQTAYADTTGSIEPMVEIPDFTQAISIMPARLKYIIKKF